jgi:hypothetical protein
VGEYRGDVGDPAFGLSCGDVGLNRGLVGEYAGEVGDSRRLVALNIGLDGLYAGELGLYGDFGLKRETPILFAGEVGLKLGEVGE